MTTHPAGRPRIEPTMEQTKFHVGDEVSVDTNNRAATATVIKTSRAAGDCIVFCQDSTPYTGNHWYWADELTLVTPAEQPPPEPDVEVTVKLSLSPRLIRNLCDPSGGISGADVWEIALKVRDQLKATENLFDKET